MRSKVAPLKEVARMIRAHLEGKVAWGKQHQIEGFLEAINGYFPGRQVARTRPHAHCDHQDGHRPVGWAFGLPSHQPSCWATRLKFIGIRPDCHLLIIFNNYQHFSTMLAST